MLLSFYTINAQSNPNGYDITLPEGFNSASPGTTVKYHIPLEYNNYNYVYHWTVNGGTFRNGGTEITMYGYWSNAVAVQVRWSNNCTDLENNQAYIGCHFGPISTGQVIGALGNPTAVSLVCPPDPCELAQESINNILANNTLGLSLQLGLIRQILVTNPGCDLVICN